MTDTGPARLPGLPALKTNDPALARWAQAVAEHLEVRAGARGNPLERAVTVRELNALDRKFPTGYGSSSGQPGDIAVDMGGGMSASLSVSAFSKALRESRLYKELTRKLDDPDRFNAIPTEVRRILLQSISEEASKRGAAISSLESITQTATASLAYRVDEITAAVEGASAGIREVLFAAATESRASAGKVTQIEASLGNYYQDGTEGRVVLEETLVVAADRVEGLAGEYMVKINAGGAVAGFGLAASEDVNGATQSSFIVQAENFAIIGTGTDPLTPFGVDTNSGTIFLNGQVKIDATGPTIEQISKSITLTASSTVFKVNQSGQPSPGSLTLTATLNNGLTGTPTFSVIDGTADLSGSVGATQSLAYANMVTNQVTVRATLTVAGYTYRNDLTLYKAFDGSTGAPGSNGANGSNGSNGAPGSSGQDGPRGSVIRYLSGGGWSDAQASAAVPGTPVIGDTVTISSSTTATTKYWSGGSWVDPGVVIDGNLLVRGTVSTDALYAGALTGMTIRGGSISIGSGSQSVLNTVNGSGGFYGMRCWNMGLRTLYVSSTATGYVPTEVMIWGDGASASLNGLRGSAPSAAGVVGGLNGKAFHAESGTAGPFTGSHDCAVPVDTQMTPGDIVVDDECLIRGDWSNTFFSVKTSSRANQKGAIGVYTHGMGLLKDYSLLAVVYDERETGGPRTDFIRAQGDSYEMVEVNAVGEGQMNVCGEGGNLEAGDLIVTSSTPGKGMKQADELIRGYTVAKCRENVTFDSPEQVKMVACIYLCG
jgi:hypothetical protein